MSQHNLIYNSEGGLIGKFRHGVAWTVPDSIRLGEYDQDFVYDNDGTTIAKYKDGYAFNTIGDDIGYLRGSEIFVGNTVVGNYEGLPGRG